MKYKEDWDKSKERLTAWWSRDVVDRCCASIVAPKVKGGIRYGGAPDDPAELRRWYMDPEWLYERATRRFENQYFGADGFPIFWSNFGTAGHAKYFRDSIYHFGKETMWFNPSVKNWQDNPLVYQPQGDILLEELNVMKRLADKSTGEFFVSMPDNCGNLDAVAHLRGTDDLLMDLYDEPEEVHAAVSSVNEALKDACIRQFDVLRDNNEGGSTHGWMMTWCPGSHMQLQVDFSVMISPEMYREFAMPELEFMTGWLDHAIYHFDGQEQIRHLDMILSLPRLNAIQWTPVAGQPETSEFIPVLRKIQKAGKGLVLVPKKHEIEKLMRGLSSEGLQLVINDAEDEAEAREIEKMIARLTRVTPEE